MTAPPLARRTRWKTLSASADTRLSYKPWFSRQVYTQGLHRREFEVSYTHRREKALKEGEDASIELARQMEAQVRATVGWIEFECEGRDSWTLACALHVLLRCTRRLRVGHQNHAMLCSGLKGVYCRAR